jgi:mono/diheme cytochrome c family protein
MRSSFLVAGAGLLLVVFARASAQSGPQAPTPLAKGQQQAVGAVTGNVEHGRYIAEHVAMCIECHSGRDQHGNIIESERYLGAPIPPGPPWATDWALRAPRNKGLLGYDDALAMRLLTEGSIGRDGTPLKPPMPRFRMTPQDAADVIAFLRSLP